MVHFKTSEQGLIQAAFTGNQESIKLQEVGKNFKPLLLSESKKYFEVERSNLPKDVNVVGRNPDGGFWDSPFGIDERAIWHVKGSGSG